MDTIRWVTKLLTFTECFKLWGITEDTEAPSLTQLTGVLQKQNWKYSKYCQSKMVAWKTLNSASSHGHTKSTSTCRAIPSKEELTEQLLPNKQQKDHTETGRKGRHGWRRQPAPFFTSPYPSPWNHNRSRWEQGHTSCPSPRGNPSMAPPGTRGLCLSSSQ